MSQITFTITRTTDLDELRADFPDLGRFYGTLMDLKHEMAPGVESETITAEIGGLPIADADDLSRRSVDVLFLPAFDRAAIETNGGAYWTDATSVEDALARYLAGEMRS